LKLAQRDLTGAQASLDEAVQLMHDYNLAPGSAGSVEILQVRLWLANGNITAAANWAEKNGYKVHDTVPMLREAEYTTFARILLVQNEVYSALTLLNQLLITAESKGKIGSVIEILILQALAYLEKDDIAQALEAFECALTLAQPEGYLRIFLDEGKPIVALLQYAAKKGVYPAYIRKLLSAASLAGTKTPSSQSLIEPLSDRELEVLRLIAEGMSNGQIAEKLIIATGTVKKHINNIFGKLGVQSRTQCVARGRELNLL
jgi:LuxR family maltose regulon positive regulatory protein